MSKLFFIKNERNFNYLNKKGGWNRSFGAYNLASFATKEAALAAVPKGFDCVVEECVVKELAHEKDMEYILSFKTMLLDKNEKFVLTNLKDQSIVRFESESKAVEKAIGLDLNMDFVRVQAVKKVKPKA